MSRTVGAGDFTYAPEPGSVAPIVVRGDGRLITAADPAQAGEVLVIYGTGIGNLTATVATGDVSPIPPAEAAVRPEIELGGNLLTVDFAGLTPGSIGLAQFNARMPDSIPDGVSDLPLLIRFGGRSSQTVRLPVRGGAPPVTSSR